MHPNGGGGTGSVLVLSCKMDPSRAFLTIGSKISDFYFSAFEYKIVCGPLKEFSYHSSCSFEFTHLVYHKVFLTLFAIAKVLSGCSSFTSGIICYTKNGKYSWHCFDKNGSKFIQLKQTSGKKMCYQHEMSDLGFNEFVRIIGQLILPSLCLKETLFPLFRDVLDLDLEELLTFQDPIVFNLFIETKPTYFLKDSDKYYASVILEHNLDSIIAANKIKSLFNQNLTFTKKYIDQMENC